MERRVTLAILAGAVVLSAVTSPSVATDEPDELVNGRKIAIAVKLGVVRKLTFLAKTPTVFDLPDPSNDPTVEGATLQVFDTAGTAGSVTFVLPPAGWKGNAANAGYRYAGGDLDPICKRVIVGPKILKVVCKNFSGLTPPFEGQVAVILEVGSTSKRYCASFGGNDIFNNERKVKRRGSDAPLACPIPPGSPSGAFLDDAVL